jgi:hypothetical protein
MSKIRAAEANARPGIHVARDPRPAPASVKLAVARQAETAIRETAAIKAKRPPTEPPEQA